jgi:hypothetical protein
MRTGERRVERAGCCSAGVQHNTSISRDLVLLVSSLYIRCFLHQLLLLCFAGTNISGQDLLCMAVMCTSHLQASVTMEITGTCLGVG